jgi:hypothetical protein
VKHDPKYFLLNDDHSLRPVDMMEWAHAFANLDRSVAWTGNESKFVSTVFLGLDHRYFGDGPPMVFETMVFVDEGKTMKWPDGSERPHKTSLDIERYGSWAAAEAGHKRFVQKYLIDQKTRVVNADQD